MRFVAQFADQKSKTSDQMGPGTRELLGSTDYIHQQAVSERYRNKEKK